MRLIDGVQKNFLKASFFLAWHGNWGLGRNRNTKQLLEHPWIINREDLPPEFATGKR